MDGWAVRITARTSKGISTAPAWVSPGRATGPGTTRRFSSPAVGSATRVGDGIGRVHPGGHVVVDVAVQHPHAGVARDHVGDLHAAREQLDHVDVAALVELQLRAVP